MSRSYRKKVVDFIDKHALAIFVALLLAAAALLGRAVYHLWTERDSWKRIPIETVEAPRCAAAIEKEEANWAREMATLSTLIEAERPGHPGKETGACADLKDYLEKHLALGQQAVASYGRMTVAVERLQGLLAEAPNKFKATAALYRRYAEQEACKDMKHEY